SYIAAPLPPQPNVCDSLFATPGSSIWTILADQDGTSVHLELPARPGGPPPPPPDVPSLDAGQVFRMTREGPFVIKSNLPIEVMQGMDCEPTLASAVPTAPLLTDLYFAVLPRFDTMISIIWRQPERPIYLDGARIEETLFEPAGGGFDVGRVPIVA